jgi:hypothetical protein
MLLVRELILEIGGKIPKSQQLRKDIFGFLPIDPG